MLARFGDFTLDGESRQLRRGEDVVRLSPKAFQLLALLVARRPSAISKAELQETLWPSTFVVEANLGNLVAEIRAALGDDSKNPRFVRTVYGYGYAFARLELRQESETIDSIAILPFQGANEDCAYVADAIAESLTVNLAAISRLKVISKNAAARVGEPVNAQAAGRSFGVEAVVTGRIDASGDALRVSVEVIDVEDGSVLFARRYESGVSDLSLLQTTIVTDVISVVGSGAPAARPEHETADSEAYQLRLQGQFYSKRIDPESQHKALAFYERALAKDPGYARAWSSMARAYLMLGIFFEAPSVNVPLAKTAVEKALALDDTLVDAHVNIGLIHLLFDWDLDAARRELLSLSGVIPFAIETFACASHLLESSGRPRDASEALRRAVDVDPLSSPLVAELGCNAYYQRRYDVAIDEYEKSLELDPRNVLAYWGLGRAYAQKEMYGEALAELEKVEIVNKFLPPIILGEMGYVCARSGDKARANEILARLSAMEAMLFVDPVFRAVVHTGLRNHDEAIACLNEAFDARSGFMVSLPADPMFDPLRSDPRFQDILQRMQPSS